MSITAFLLGMLDRSGFGESKGCASERILSRKNKKPMSAKLPRTKHKRHKKRGF